MLAKYQERITIKEVESFEKQSKVLTIILANKSHNKPVDARHHAINLISRESETIKASKKPDDMLYNRAASSFVVPYRPNGIRSIS
jgi:hypothetical protein